MPCPAKTYQHHRDMSTCYFLLNHFNFFTVDDGDRISCQKDKSHSPPTAPGILSCVGGYKDGGGNWAGWYGAVGGVGAEDIE